MRRVNLLASLLLASLLLASCANIIDVEERKVGDGGTGGTGAPSCESYCADAMELCTKERSVQAYSNLETCLGVCSKLPTTPSLTGNTLACRQDQLDKLRGAGALESKTYCPGGGAAGGAAVGEPASSACGTDCEGYCAIRQATCPDYIEPDCVRKCQALPTTGAYNADANFGDGTDSLNCRIAHLSAAALYERMGRNDDRKSHCEHSGIRSKVQCDVNGTASLVCADFCKITTAACTGDSAVYESPAQCEAFCAKQASGTMMDNLTSGTVRCAREGAYDALEIGTRQCPNAGPAPDRCGRGRCQGYCELAQKGCPAQFAATYPGGAMECETKCAAIPGSSQNDPYAVTAAVSKNGNTLQCRLLRVTRVLAGDINPVTCDEALGKGSCQ